MIRIFHHRGTKSTERQPELQIAKRRKQGTTKYAKYTRDMDERKNLPGVKTAHGAWSSREEPERVASGGTGR